MFDGRRLKEKRVEKGMTMEDVAKMLDVAVQTIYKYESGKVTNVPVEKVEALANAVNTNPGYLLGWDDEESPTTLRHKFSAKHPYRLSLPRFLVQEPSSEYSTSTPMEDQLLDEYKKLGTEEREKLMVYIEDLNHGLSAEEKKMIDGYRDLSDDSKQKVRDYVQDLTYIEKYRNGGQ